MIKINIKTNYKEFMSLGEFKPYKLFMIYGVISIIGFLISLLFMKNISPLGIFNILLAFGFAFYIRKDVLRVEIKK